MEEEFVPYEIALNLREKGFDKQCFAYFDVEKEIQPIDTDFKNFRSIGECIAAPLWQQVIDWFRKNHNIEIIVENGPVDLGYSYHIYYKKDGRNRQIDGFGHDELDEIEYDYPEARLKAINQALTLI